ncbi:MAG: class I SAM-dependent methyltransferase [Actinobacteria bacterium]|nr:MAG: class I SAM-dependent methyltransferase [Actinomycetota bacterium]
MADADYVREYFSGQAAGWVTKAYEEPAEYPVGVQRVRLALQSVVERAGRSCELIDLGCGGGELCIDAARIGMSATGLDIAEGMIAEAGKKREQLTPELRERLSFVVGNVLETGLGDETFDAATAIGVVEYLPEDSAFLAETQRLLRPGGTLVISCRNRLFNMASLNAYTQEEIEDGNAARLLSEMLPLQSERLPENVLRNFVASLETALPRLSQAIAADEAMAPGGPPQEKPVGPFAQPRRQHTPEQLADAAGRAGFSDPTFVAAHPHPLPPSIEKQYPHFYNQLARLFEAFERQPQSLLWSSTFIAVFTKPG